MPLRGGMLVRKLLLPAVFVGGLAIAAITIGAPALPHKPASALNGAPSSFNSASYSSCTTHPASPCLSPLLTLGYTTTAKTYLQMCNMSEFSGYPFGSNANLNSTSKTIKDAWSFAADPVNFLDIQATFKDTSNVVHTVSFPTTATPPSTQTNSASVYYTKNYSRVAVLTPAGWTLTGGTGLMNGLPNKLNIFLLVHTCPAGSTLSNYSNDEKACDYPDNPSHIDAYKSTYGSTYNVSGHMHENDCDEPHEKVHCSGKGGYSKDLYTDSYGKFNVSSVPKSAFPLTFTYGGNTFTGWPAALSYFLS
jgi:hypothetical protein